MKKSSLLILSALLLVSLLLPLISCSKDNNLELISDLESDIFFEELEGAEHLSPETATVIFPDAERVESEATSEAITESPTAPSTESESEEISTEEESESQTEVKPSLQYTSYGNGTCAVSGIGEYSDVYVIIPERSPAGDIVCAIEEKAFFENSTIKAIQIPSTVMSIGKMAFGSCSSLIYISVDSNNKMFVDENGILYSKDKSKLYAFPSANQAAEISIPLELTEIADMAFFSTPSLKEIKYAGSLESWLNIKVGDKNYGLYSASVSFAIME